MEEKDSSDISSQELDAGRKALIQALNLSFNILKVIMALLILFFLTSGIFTVKQDEVGVVLRFGRIRGTLADRILQPGLHWAFPPPIDEVITIPMGKIQSVAIKDFWYRKPRGEEELFPQLDPLIDGYCLTGDVNIINSYWTVRYKISDPIAYLTYTQEHQKLVEAVVKDSILKITGRYRVDAALRMEVESLRKEVEWEAQNRLEKLGCGLRIERIDLERISPPLQVKKYFDDVVQAEQEKSEKINEALGYENRLVNQAQGEAKRIISEAEAYRSRVVREALADSRYFDTVYQQYLMNPSIFVYKYWQDVMSKVLGNLKEKYVLYQGRGKDELRINISPELFKKGEKK